MAEMQYPESPETTGLYLCKACGNDCEFVGIDENGYGGPDACDCRDRDEECYCSTELTQSFWVGRDEDGTLLAPEYLSHEGGDDGAEIGSYTRIECGKCNAILWKSITPGTNEAAGL